MSRKLWIASDHAGVELKASLKERASEWNVEFIDLGTHNTDSVHYPNIAKNFCQELLSAEANLNEPCGILICGSGIGVSIGANRFPQIRAALAYNKETAKLAKQHNNANVLCLGARFMSEEAPSMVEAWLETEFEGGRHQTRVDMLGSVNSD